MALPVLSKTWQFNVNQNAGGSGISGNAGAQADCQSLMFTMKQSMKNIAQAPWTVQGSSDGSTSGMDAVDRITTAAGYALRQFPANTIGWVVLRQTGIAPKFEVVWGITNSTNGNNFDITVKISPSAGFGTVNGGTNGSTTALPTATDEITLANTLNNRWNGQNAAPAAWKVHYMQTTDGTSSRMVIHISNVVQVLMMFEKPSNTPAGWVNPNASLFFSGGNTPVTVATYNNTFVNAFTLGRFNSSAPSFAMFWGTEGVNNVALGQFANSSNDLTSEFIMTPISVVSTATAGSRDRLGLLQDIWFGSNLTQEGITYPSNTSRQFVQFRDIIFPWNGSVPLIS